MSCNYLPGLHGQPCYQCYLVCAAQQAWCCLTCTLRDVLWKHCQPGALSGQLNKQCRQVPWAAPAPNPTGLRLLPSSCGTAALLAMFRIEGRDAQDSGSALWLQVEATGTTPCFGRWTLSHIVALEKDVCAGNSP